MKSIHILKYTLTALVGLCLFGCEEKMVTIPDFEPPVSDKVVLVEELTGVSCPNCPAGSTKLASLIQKFEGKVVGVGIHGEFLAEPIEDKSIYDFRNDVVRDIEFHLSPFQGKPAAVINRVFFEGEGFLGVDNIDLWEGYVQQEFDKPEILTFGYQVDYDISTRQVSIDIDMFPATTMPGSYAFHLMVLESHIIDAQKDVEEIIDEYEHNHVLRDMMTGTLGDAIGGNYSPANPPSSRNYTYTLPESDGTWIPENIELVGFVTDITGGGEEVIQAFEAHLIE